MLYNTLRFLFRLTAKGYFRSITVSGRENIPEYGPVIFAPNHPSAFMDPILLATEIDRTLYFLARGDLFSKQIAGSLFRLLNMIPVYRRDETPGHSEKNDEVFRECFRHLARRKALMIFPEGNSKTERNLRPLKTGIARIALGAEQTRQFGLGVKVVPVGINYSNPHDFRSDVIINFGKPIEAAEHWEAFARDERQAVAELTDRLRTEMEKLLIIVQNEQLDQLVRRIEQLYRSTLREGMEPAQKGVQDFQLSKEIVSAVDYHIAHDPRRVGRFEEDLNAYINGLKELNLRDTQVRASRINLDVVRSVLFFVLGFPVYLYGYITNYVPYRVAGLISNAIPLRDDFVGSIKIAVGMFIFLILYIAEAVVVGTVTHVGWALLFVTSLYPAGVFTLNYIKRYFKLAGTVRYLRLFMSKSDLVAKLKVTRSQLIAELEAGRQEYLAARERA